MEKIIDFLTKNYIQYNQYLNMISFRISPTDGFYYVVYFDGLAYVVKTTPNLESIYNSTITRRCLTQDEVIYHILVAIRNRHDAAIGCMVTVLVLALIGCMVIFGALIS